MTALSTEAANFGWLLVAAGLELPPEPRTALDGPAACAAAVGRPAGRHAG